jgi:hypothetical protein
MKSLIFRASLTLCLVIALAASVMWWRSWRVCEGVKWVRNDGSRRELVSYAGGIILSETRPGLATFPATSQTQRVRIHEPVTQGTQPSWRSRVPGGASAEVVWESAGLVAASGQTQSAGTPVLATAVSGTTPIIWNTQRTALLTPQTYANVVTINGGSLQPATVSTGPTQIQLDESSAEAVQRLPGTSLVPLINNGMLQPVQINRTNTLTLTAASVVFKSPLLPVHYQVLKVPYWLIIALCGLLPAHSLLGVPAALRRRRRRLKGLCMHCGYDLRASEGRCPECGTAKPNALTPPPSRAGR